MRQGRFTWDKVHDIVHEVVASVEIKITHYIITTCDRCFGKLIPALICLSGSQVIMSAVLYCTVSKSSYFVLFVWCKLYINFPAYHSMYFFVVGGH